MFLIKGQVQLTRTHNWMTLFVYDYFFYGKRMAGWGNSHAVLFSTEVEAQEFIEKHKEELNAVEGCADIQIIEI